MSVAWLEKQEPGLYWSDNFIVFDVETTNKEKGSALNTDNQLVCASWVTGYSEPRLHWGDESNQQELLDAIYAADFVVAHNAKFDLQWMARAGLDLRQVLVFDTQLAEYVLLGNRKQPLTLDAIAQRRGIGGKFSVVSSLIKGGVCPSTISESMLAKYAVQDTVLTRTLMLQQRQELEDKSLLPVLLTRCLLTPVLTDIEKNGMYLDSEKLRTEFLSVSLENERLEDELLALTGGINPNSPAQVAEFLYDVLQFNEIKNKQRQPIRTAGGRRKADATTINALRATTKDQADFLLLKKKQSVTNAALTKYLRKFWQCCEDDEGLLLAKFNQAVSRTHRLTSSGLRWKVQFQNFPRVFKPLFTARHQGWLMGEADGAQLEFRVAAFLGNDAQARHDIENKVDVHRMSSEIIGVNRQEAKAHTFKPLYGGFSGTRKEQKYYDAFRDKYSSIYNTQKGWAITALDTKVQVTPWGLIYYWPDCNMRSSGYIEYSPSIFNYPVQALATAEIIPIALVYMWHRIKDAGARMFLVNTVHDSVVAELPADERELFSSIAVQSFTHDVYKYLKRVYGLDFDVPLGTGVKIGSHWGVGDEVKTDVSPY